MEDRNPANEAKQPTTDAVIILANTPEFEAFLAGRTELINRPLREQNERNHRLRLIGEIVEVAAKEELDLAPNQILAIADAAIEDPKIARGLTPATFGIIVNKPNRSEQ